MGRHGNIARRRWPVTGFTNEARSETNPMLQGEPGSAAAGGPWPSRGLIEYENVTARYHEVSPDALKGISFIVPAGSKVGVCGRTGSGKSTLISTLSRMIDLRHGSIVIDGIDIAVMSPEVLRPQLIGISQQSYIIPELSVREKPMLGCKTRTEDSQLINALIKVHLWDSICERGGLSSVPDNDTLSPGQIQLFSCEERSFDQVQLWSWMSWLVISLLRRQH
ncbi:hypothetical protein BBP40_010653 [Aspergillus hancockii]|nr:hypothetical protein BBP40_010653 [Aspergillus hancockii]